MAGQVSPEFGGYLTRARRKGREDQNHGLGEAEPVGQQASDRRDDYEYGSVERPNCGVGPRLQSIGS